MAADTFLYTPLNVGLFFALMTVVEGGRWKVSMINFVCYLLQSGAEPVAKLACIMLPPFKVGACLGNVVWSIPEGTSTLVLASLPQHCL